MTDLRAAAQALVDRWDTPLWKDVPATAEYINALRAALSAPAGLLPIDTAPMDGTEFLGFRNGQFANAYRVQRDDCEMWSFGRQSGDAALYPECKPTHWMPLPAAPSPQEQT